VDQDADPYVFEPPWIRLRIRLWLHYDFLSLKNDLNVALKGNKQKNLFKKIEPDPLGRGTDPWIRIRANMSRIPNTDLDVDPASRVLRFLFSVGTTVRMPC